MNVISRLIHDRYDISHSANSVHNIKFVPRTLNIDFEMPTNGDLLRNIIEMPLTKISPLQEPVTRLPIQYNYPPLEKPIELPPNGETFEKRAVRLIVIRRHKIKKHKRRKLRKKMKYLWAKIRLRRSTQREKEFQAGLISQIKTAQVFDAKAYVNERLNILNKERIPRTYRGELLPTEMIKQFLEEKKAKREAKRNKPRLTL